MSVETSEIITGAMETVAERAGDITPRVFERYFHRSAASQALMEHMDEHMLGRMMDQVLLLLMETDDDELNSYLNFETRNHISYGVTDDMYDNLMAAVVDVVREALGDDFTPEVEGGFNQRVDFLLSAIHGAAAREQSRVAV